MQRPCNLYLYKSMQSTQAVTHRILVTFGNQTVRAETADSRMLNAGNAKRKSTLLTLAGASCQISPYSRNHSPDNLEDSRQICSLVIFRRIPRITPRQTLFIRYLHRSAKPLLVDVELSHTPEHEGIDTGGARCRYQQGYAGTRSAGRVHKPLF